MTLISKFQEFEENNPLHGKITPVLAESLAEYFADDESVNEGVFDSIKNTLSKTFLGSLSYISMIDKVRSEILKLEKETVQKRHDHEDEMGSLKNSFREFTKAKDEPNSNRISRTIESKIKEHKAFEKVMDTRIEKAITTIKSAIKGSKRRMEYWEAGKSQDELELIEFEYKLAKQRASTDSESLKDLQLEIDKAKKEADRTKSQLETSAKAQEKSAGESSEYDIKTKKGRNSAIAEIEHKIVEFNKELKSTRKSFDKQKIELEITNLNGLKKIIEETDKKLPKGKIISNEEFERLNLPELKKKIDRMLADKEGPKSTVSTVGSAIPGTSNASKETAKEKGKTKPEEVKKQESPAPTSSKVNSSIAKNIK